ncbi:MAG: molybdopterin molybdotransferase MoeA [Planctomycetes bacterium]|nr:molybdopterin molybdotransferase MoeA [Planctomycetota bacterium]
MKYDIGFEEALSKTLQRLTPLPPIDIEIDKAAGLAVAEKCIAAVNCPSASSSTKDGYAVVSQDLDNASQGSPVKLKVTGSVFAGSQQDNAVVPGSAVKIMTGAKIPQGANAVIPCEFTEVTGDEILCYRDTGVGRNILRKGHDVVKGDCIALPGEILMPAKAGFMAAGGISSVSVHPLPRVGIIAIGDEVVRPGESLKEGQLYASNIVALTCWLKLYHINTRISTVPDHVEKIHSAIETMLENVDVIITSGGAWKSERDLTVRTFEDMGGEIIFHRIRMGPGKAVAAILLKGKTVFCLPGGPPSNAMAFMQIALPAILHLAGKTPIPFEIKTAALAETLKGDKDWTQFHYARLVRKDGQLFVEPMKIKSRLQSQADADALIKIPEGIDRLEKGEQIQIQVLFSRTQ